MLYPAPTAALAAGRGGAGGTPARTRPREVQAVEVEPEEAEDVKIRSLEDWAGDAAGPAAVAGGGKRRRVKREREAVRASAATEAGPREVEAVEVEPEEAEAEEVVICKLERAVEAATGKPAAAAVGGKRRREGDGAAEAGPSGQGRGRTAPSQADKASRYRGVTKAQGGKGAKP